MDSANAASGASAKRSSSLAQRVLTAAIAVPVLAGLIWLGVWSLALLVTAAVVVGLNELYGGFTHAGFRPRVAVGIAAGLLFCVVAATRPFTPADLIGPALALIVCGSLLAELARRDREGALVNWALTLAGACYVGWLFSHFILLRQLQTPLRPGSLLALLHIDAGAAWVYAVLAITWLQDTGAYFTGRAIGRHKMAPALSPNKTWEGAVRRRGVVRRHGAAACAAARPAHRLRGRRAARRGWRRARPRGRPGRVIHQAAGGAQRSRHAAALATAASSTAPTVSCLQDLVLYYLILVLVGG